jgi:predicted transcriptional regulator
MFLEAARVVAVIGVETRREWNTTDMGDKKEKPISIRLSPKALARLNRLTVELDMNRTSVIQEALKVLDREHEAHKAGSQLPEPVHAQNGTESADHEEPRETLLNGNV